MSRIFLSAALFGATAFGLITQASAAGSDVQVANVSASRVSRYLAIVATTVIADTRSGSPVAVVAKSTGKTVASKRPGAKSGASKSAAATTAVSKQSNPSPFSIDARVNLYSAFSHSAAARPSKRNSSPSIAKSQLATSVSALAALKQTLPRVQAHYSQETGALASLSNPSGWLTVAAAQASSETIVRQFLGTQKALFGLSSNDLSDLAVLGDSPGGSSHLRMLRIEQQVNGRPVFQSESRFVLSADGRLAKYVGALVANARSSTVSIADSDWMAPAQAVVDLLAFEGSSVSANSFQTKSAANGRTLLSTSTSYIKGDVTARQVWFPLEPGLLVPAWSLVVFTHGPADWYAVIDAQTGDVLWRKNMRANASTQEARFNVYVQGDGKTPSESPAPHSPTAVTPGSGTQFPEIARTTVNMSTVQDISASPNGWIADGGNTTTGNNTDTYLDTDADDAPDTGLLDNNGRPVGNLDASSHNRDFLGTGYAATPAPMGGNPDAGTAPTDAQFQRMMLGNLFYLVNWYHDQLYALGFDEASANFQTTNFSGMGVGGDPVLAEGQDGSGTDNSNFSTPPDGTSGRMQMYIFDFPTPNRDGGLDADIALHELTHGLSNRLIGNGNGLIWDVGGGMGEGWSDFFALSLINNTNTQDPNAEYPMGAYATYQFLGLTDNYLYGIRRFPYSTDNSVNPLTWADVDDFTYNTSGGITPSPLPFSASGALEVHNVGEIWAESLWEVRSRVIGDPAGANGDVPTGNHTMLQLTVDALKMTPINPSFTDARDALIDADCTTNACANEGSIWGGFADRGLGYGAVATSGEVGVMGHGAQSGVGESFSVPYLDIQSVTIDDSTGNNNGAIDPGEPIHITVNLLNPWRNAAKGITSATSTLTTSTPGVTISNNSSTFGAIGAQGTADGTPFFITVPTSAVCGDALHFTLTTTSSLGTTSKDFVLRVGADDGDGTDVTYTRTIPGGLAIPDDNLNGVSDSLTIPDDLEINKVKFRIDDLAHTFTGDLTVALKGPNGYGNDMAYIRGYFIGDNDGDNFINTVFDDAATNDLNLSGAADAPYTDSWTPAFNGVIWSLFGIPNLGPDPVGELSRFNGLSTMGTWSVHVTDESQFDTGALNTWSLIVTPKAFTCSVFTPTINITATDVVSGALHVGGTVTYTVVLTNTGNGTQNDNPGHEFTDALPSGLTLTGATATAGTASTTGNTVFWDGALTATGSVTITINATINAGQQGMTISSQGTVAYDSDGNGTNDSSALTDDPGVGGTADPTVFNVADSAITATKTVAGSFTSGSLVTYTVVMSNSGDAASPDNAGHEFTDTLPAGITLAGISATSGTGAMAGQTATWDGSIPAGGSVTITITATVDAIAVIGSVISNQGTVAFDADLNGTNESTILTDDPSVGGAQDPTSFTVTGAVVAATKTVAGSFTVGSTVTYTIVMSNSGNLATTDNAGNEFTDVLPTGLTLLGATATSGAAVANAPTRTVTWNGGIAAGGSATITITAAVAASGGQTLSNQASFTYNAGATATNDTSGLTDDPGLPGSSDPTIFVAVAVATAPIVPGPMLSVWMTWLLILGTAAIASARLHKRRTN